MVLTVYGALFPGTACFVDPVIRRNAASPGPVGLHAA